MNKNTKKSYCRLLQQSAVPELKDKKVISLERSSPPLIFSKRNFHKGRPTIMGHFGHTYLPMSYAFYTMPITLVRFLLRYLPTPKSDVLYERSLLKRFASIFSGLLRIYELSFYFLHFCFGFFADMFT